MSKLLVKHVTIKAKRLQVNRRC